MSVLVDLKREPRETVWPLQATSEQSGRRKGPPCMYITNPRQDGPGLESSHRLRNISFLEVGCRLEKLMI